MKYIFIGFIGWEEPPMDQESNTFLVAENFELWNLRKFSLEDFVAEIKSKIPPVNNNVLRNYLNDGTENYGINEEQYKKSLWGLLVPDPSEHFSGYQEVLALINIFSPRYMKPYFQVTNMGIEKVNSFNVLEIPPNDYQGYQNFETTNFTSFYNELISEMKYSVWVRPVVLGWQEEDWRLYMASVFYQELKEFEMSKSTYTWQRESASMAILLETLFTAGDTQNEKIGYRLRKRVGALIQWKYPNIEKDIKGLYNDRSEFIHGSYYKKIISGMRRNENDDAFPPTPDFDKLYKTKEKIRFIYTAYLYLHKIKNLGNEIMFNDYKNIQEMLEVSILNIELRNKITEVVKPILDKLPENSPYNM
jgi:hypothetical protein